MTSIDAAQSHHQLFQQLEGLYHALALAVQDPIVIPNPEFQQETPERLGFDSSKVYFYVDDDNGTQLVQSRITLAATDITHSYQAHKEMSSLFSLLEQYARQQEKYKFAQSTKDLCYAVEKYASFIDDHQERLGEKAFLAYPCFADNHVSYRRHLRSQAIRQDQEGNLVQLGIITKTVDSIAAPVAYFNPKGTSQGIKDETCQLRLLANQLPAFHKKLWSEIYTGHPDASYPKMIELTRMLLKEHLGFEVEP